MNARHGTDIAAPEYVVFCALWLVTAVQARPVQWQAAGCKPRSAASAAVAAAALQEWATAHGISLPNHYDTTNQPTFKLDDHHPKNILQVCV
jgi:hypothetical protein